MALIRQMVLLVFVVLLAMGCGLPGTETGNPGPGGDPSSQPGDQPPDGVEDGTGIGEEPTFDPGDVADGIISCPNQTSAPEVPETVLDELIERICLEIFICDKLIGTLDCIDALHGPDGEQILDEFGIEPEGVFTVSQINFGLDQGAITVDELSFSDCTADIAAITCNDVTTNASMNDLSNVENIIPTACISVFSVPTDIVEACSE